MIGRSGMAVKVPWNPLSVPRALGIGFPPGRQAGGRPDSGSVGNLMNIRQWRYLHLFDGEPVPIFKTFDQYLIGAFS
jgi:hypothetical protein